MPDINSEYHIVDTKRPRRFLKHLDDNFLIQARNRKGAFLDLWLVNIRGYHG